jgi:hypothetical protein
VIKNINDFKCMQTDQHCVWDVNVYRKEKRSKEDFIHDKLVSKVLKKKKKIIRSTNNTAVMCFTGKMYLYPCTVVEWWDEKVLTIFRFESLTSLLILIHDVMKRNDNMLSVRVILIILVSIRYRTSTYNDNTNR